jgi:hypothetical protein
VFTDVREDTLPTDCCGYWRQLHSQTHIYSVEFLKEKELAYRVETTGLEIDPRPPKRELRNEQRTSSPTEKDGQYNH